ncbi:MAG TPA: ATP-binding protein, partial [Phototrophicaceae bacterium]|nr:ATP-binding protein [Phototrophicaceae bacterium]
DLRSLAGRWLQPRSTDRDEAFRERSIRVAIAVVVVIGLISFAFNVLVFRNAWSPISFPTLHVVVLLGFFAAAYAITRGQINESATLVVITSLIAACGFTILTRQENPYSELASGMPVFMFVILLTALVLPRNMILPISVVAVVLDILAILSVADATHDPSLDASTAYVAVVLLFPTEGAILHRLRVEFDARLDAMRELIVQAETAKQQAEEARQQAEINRKRAEESDKAKSQFLANMSHELRTPLNAIIGYDEAMLGGLAGEFAPQQSKLLGHIQYNSRRLLGLINDILDLSKVESGSLQVFLAPMSPQKIIRETAESLRSLADEKKIYLDVKFSDDVPEVVLGDANKLQQIVANLLSNSIKFTEQGGVTIEVGTLDASNWQIHVRDTGIGMPANAVTYIFEPFQQVDGTERRKYKGTGLGLAITKRLVERLGGSIKVDTMLGEGSTFTISLPRAQIPSDVAEAQPARAGS